MMFSLKINLHVIFDSSFEVLAKLLKYFMKMLNDLFMFLALFLLAGLLCHYALLLISGTLIISVTGLMFFCGVRFGLMLATL